MRIAYAVARAECVTRSATPTIIAEGDARRGAPRGNRVGAVGLRDDVVSELDVADIALSKVDGCSDVTVSAAPLLAIKELVKRNDAVPELGITPGQRLNEIRERTGCSVNQIIVNLEVGTAVGVLRVGVLIANANAPAGATNRSEQRRIVWTRTDVVEHVDAIAIRNINVRRHALFHGVSVDLDTIDGSGLPHGDDSLAIDCLQRVVADRSAVVLVCAPRRLRQVVARLQTDA